MSRQMTRPKRHWSYFDPLTLPKKKSKQGKRKKFPRSLNTNELSRAPPAVSTTWQQCYTHVLRKRSARDDWRPLLTATVSERSEGRKRREGVYGNERAAECRTVPSREPRRATTINSTLTHIPWNALAILGSGTTFHHRSY